MAEWDLPLPSWRWRDARSAWCGPSWEWMGQWQPAGKTKEVNTNHSTAVPCGCKLHRTMQIAGYVQGMQNTASVRPWHSFCLVMQSSLTWACSGAAAPSGGRGETVSALAPAGACRAARAAAMCAAGVRRVVEDEGIGLGAACRQESLFNHGCCDVAMLCGCKLCAGSAGCCRAQGTVENLQCAPAYAARTHLRGRQRAGRIQSGWLWDLGSLSWWRHQDRWSRGVC